MILPILAFGHPNLRKKSVPVEPNDADLPQLISDMWETMYLSNGVGLAAPQVDKRIRLFVVDATPYAEEEPEAVNFKRVIINPEIVEERGEEWAFNEGCLSVPEVHEDVMRKPEVHLRYQDENFKQHDEWLSGMPARIVQHEFDHLEGVIFVDKIYSLRKIMIKRRLQDITKGNIEKKYKMQFAPNKHR